MSLTVKTAPASEPITTAEAKTHLNVTISDDDTYIDSLIKAARLQAETYLRRSLITQTLELRLDAFPRTDAIKLPMPPVASLSSVSYVDSNGDAQTWTDTQIDIYSEPARLLPSYGNSYPSTRDQLNAVTITYVAGYGNASAVPQDIKAAILLLVGEMYEHREESVVGTVSAKLPMTAERLLSPYRVLDL